jgi:hypothetical protein
LRLVGEKIASEKDVIGVLFNLDPIHIIMYLAPQKVVNTLTFPQPTSFLSRRHFSAACASGSLKPPPFPSIFNQTYNE